jgi:threonine/homoserine efflux transporter RhtA
MGPALLVVVAAISQEVGAAFAVGLFATLGAIGAAFAAGAGASWAGYILASARAASEFPSLDALAIATAIGAVVTAPVALLQLDE